MSKPKFLSRWATGVLAVVVTPTEGEKDVGWPEAQRPPAGWWNWLWLRVYEWQRYTGGVPGANWILRNAAPISQPFQGAAQAAGAGALLLEAFEGIGDDVFVGGPTDKYDEWWIGGDGTDAPGADNLWRYTRGLGGQGVGISGNIADVDPREMFHDGTQYVLGGLGSTFNPHAETSVDGITWINTFDAGAGQFERIVWNGLTGASSRYMMITIESGTAVSYTSSDSGLSWTPNGALGSGVVDPCGALVYSPTLGLWVAGGFRTGALTALFTSADDGATWVDVVTPASYDWHSAVLLDSGDVLVVGFTSLSGGSGVIGVVTGASTFVEVTVKPNNEAFTKVSKRGDRLLLEGQDAPGGSTVEGVQFYDSYGEGGDGTWRRSGRVVSALPGTKDEVTADTSPSMKIIMTDSEVATVVQLRGDPDVGTLNVVISELSHPDTTD